MRGKFKKNVVISMPFSNKFYLLMYTGYNQIFPDTLHMIHLLAQYTAYSLCVCEMLKV